MDLYLYILKIECLVRQRYKRSVVLVRSFDGIYAGSCAAENEKWGTVLWLLRGVDLCLCVAAFRNLSDGLLRFMQLPRNKLFFTPEKIGLQAGYSVQEEKTIQVV